MPNVIIPIADTQQSVQRPVIMQITRDLFKITGIEPDTQILYPGDLEKALQPNSTMNADGTKVSFNQNDRMTIEVEEDYEKDRILSTAIFYPENMFIFRDDRLQIAIKPAYSSSDVSINFRYRTVDKNKATRWRDDMRARASTMRDINLHVIEFYYIFPPVALKILEELHKLRETVEPYGEDFAKYLTDNSTKRLSLAQNQDASQEAYVISDTQRRIQGWFDFEGVPEKSSRVGEADTWEISFSYKLKYDRPIECQMTYPITVHNQPLDLKYVPTEAVDEDFKHKLAFSRSGEAYRHFEAVQHLAPVAQGYAIPPYDNFFPENNLPKTRRVITALTLEDTDFPGWLLSLRELGDIELKPELLAFLVKERTFMPKPYYSVFFLNVWCMQTQTPPSSVICDEDLDVHLTFERDLRKEYRMGLSIVTDLSMLTPEAQERLRLNYPVLVLVVNTIDPTIKVPPPLGDRLPRSDWLDLVNNISKNVLKGDAHIRTMNTVETLAVIAQRREDATIYR